MTKGDQSQARAGPFVLMGFAAVFILLGGLGFWGAGARISGAIIAPGVVEVESNRHVIQHPNGGVVKKVVVRDGDFVDAGDVVLRLDDAEVASEISRLEAQITALLAQQERLRAEATADAFSGADSALTISDSAPVSQQTDATEEDIFKARASVFESQIAQLDAQIQQGGAEITGVAAQSAALERSRVLLEEDLERAVALRESGLLQETQLVKLQREHAALEGEIGRLGAHQANVKGMIAALELEKTRLKAARQEEALEGLRVASLQEAELRAQLKSVENKRQKLTLRAPVSGFVYQSKIFTEQAVVRGAEPLMFIVPSGQPLIATARIAPRYIDDVTAGAEVNLRFTSFAQLKSPDIPGRLVSLSADVLRDEGRGASYYEARVAFDEGVLHEFSEADVIPGMPVEVYFLTQPQSPLAYLVKPFTDYLNRAFREP